VRKFHILKAYKAVEVKLHKLLTPGEDTDNGHLQPPVPAGKKTGWAPKRLKFCKIGKIRASIKKR
jgi:hypothetical protein